MRSVRKIFVQLDILGELVIHIKDARMAAGAWTSMYER